MLKKMLWIFTGILVILIIAFVAGPRPTFKKIDNKPSSKSYDIETLDYEVAKREAAVQFLKPDNEARVVWADSIPSKTKYSLVYLHGFSASQAEGAPVHINLAKRLGANLYLPRLSGHGIDTKEAMSNLTPGILIKNAKDAIAIGKSIGEKVIVMGCSTGGTLGIYLAANDPAIEALILLSPNIAIKDPTAAMVTGPWGEELAYQMIGPYREFDGTTNPYWSDKYSTNGIIALQALLDQTMTNKVFEKVTCPVYCGYYYKDEDNQDPVVSVDAMLDFKEHIGTPSAKVLFQPFANVGNHVIASKYKTDNWKEVEDGVFAYLQNKIVEN
ncbi:MAG: pimeloyl-ACP methyl ester carboxylesterase [Saprospiraceae bacterium]|jgi:pimeloyl-ACP methyl ester carboxylesterase